MFCCFDTPNGYTPVDNETANNGVGSSVSAFPGQRRMTNTNGNALAAYDTNKQQNYNGTYGQPGFSQHPQQQMSTNNVGKQSESMHGTEIISRVSGTPY
eukprot:634811-Ditylum_brightwellii.AAC.1